MTTTTHNCPHCGHPLKTRPAKKKQRRVRYVNAYGKPVYRSKLMERIMDARESGALTSPEPFDWFPRYLAALPKSVELAEQEKALNAKPLPWEEYDCRNQALQADIRNHKRDIFGG